MLLGTYIFLIGCVWIALGVLTTFIAQGGVVRRMNRTVSTSERMEWENKMVIYVIFGIFAYFPVRRKLEDKTNRKLST